MIEIDEVNNVGTHEVLYLEKISTPKILENGFLIFSKISFPKLLLINNS